ncbi:hypothetical protein SDRG_12794 [Saprolegnia diclina VS20]|uniref:Tudor-knot domain-containing protein n=1 Tax=Saprolegnia diclina (strain VS20) TaxID=1156394 RepID=T0Q7W0_SAPDV|nr:hypothetical protein SDRG_12794 [Saprolegnia diclina VS20]EQC29545.1 hypothetical protein SDRG_12794 [Saprolegnia diclina VS20]|eukprot:XP_008617097.1 hypothetical protein SDRG_12794 [Saprolegnia diclina VS20]
MQPTISPSSDGTRMTRRTAVAAARPKRHASPPTVPAKPAVRTKRAKKVDVKSPRKEREPKYVALGMLADVRDDKGRWSEARVIDVDVDAQKVHVHFLGWHKRFDTWVAQSAFAPHGARVASAKKDEKSMKRSHINAAHLFAINPKYTAHEKDSGASEDDAEAEASTVDVAKEASRGRPRKRKVAEAKTEAAQPERSPSPPTKHRKSLRMTNVAVEATVPTPAPLSPPAPSPVALAPPPVEPTTSTLPRANMMSPMRPLTAAREMAPPMVMATPPAMQPQSGYAPSSSTKTVLAEIFRQRVQQQIAELVENQKGKVAKKQQQQPKPAKASSTKPKRSDGMPFPPVMPVYQANMAAFHRPLQANAAFLQESIDAWRAQQDNLMKDITSVVCL